MSTADNTVIVDDWFAFKTWQIHWEKLGSLDIETTVEDNPWRDTPQLVSLAVTYDGHRSFVFKNDEFLQAAKTSIQYTDWIMHNGLFDRLMLKAFFDIDAPLKHDTMAMQYLLDPDLPKSLEEMSEAILGLPAYKGVDYHHILEEDWDVVAEMNAEDTRRTFNLFRPLADKINKDKALSKIYQWLLMPAIQELIEITLTGVPLDGERLAKLTIDSEEEASTLLTDLRDTTPLPEEGLYPKGWPRPSSWRVTDLLDDDGTVIRKGDGKWDGTQFNPGSPNQVRHILFDQWQLPVLEWTKPEKTEPKPSTNADVLLQLETFHTNERQQPWLHDLRQYRKATKLLSYFYSWMELTDHKGYLHPRFRPLRVVTGRLSSSDPNIQQVPRQKEVRSVFGGVEGYTWIKADYSQIELRLAALAANEETMLEAYRKGEDLHRLTARLVLGDDSDDARQVGKTLNFGLLYGAGPATLQRVARSDYNVFLSEGEARKYRTDFFRAYPGIAHWHKHTESLIVASGQARSPLGRVRYLPKAKIPWEVVNMRSQKAAAIREGINHTIQSFASDLLLMSIVRMRPVVGDLAHLIAAVHDEVDLLALHENVSQVTGIVQEVMEDTSWLARFGIKLGVPVLADVETGPYWGEVA